jgi:apolipoprotein D and lipocalin family protein
MNMRNVALGLSAIVLAALAGGCFLSLDTLFPSLPTVSAVELTRYAGKWYEIARYPNWFEGGCNGVTAEYTPRDDGTVGVLNICRDPNGVETSRIEGYATVADPQQPGKLTVYFSTAPFGAPYWILALGTEYDYAIVGDPTRSFLWILSRTPTMDATLYQSLLDQLPQWGYDPARLEPVAQPTGS